jgi:hypothetical protein
MYAVNDVQNEDEGQQAQADDAPSTFADLRPMVAEGAIASQYSRRERRDEVYIGISFSALNWDSRGELEERTPVVLLQPLSKRADVFPSELRTQAEAEQFSFISYEQGCRAICVQIPRKSSMTSPALCRCTGNRQHPPIPTLRDHYALKAKIEFASGHFEDSMRDLAPSHSTISFPSCVE